MMERVQLGTNSRLLLALLVVSSSLANQPQIASAISAVSSQSSDSISHLGCYFLTNPDYVLSKAERQVGDNYDLMPYYRHTMTGGVTPERCSQFCQTKGLLFAALKQNECSCGISMDGMRLAETGSLVDQCSHRCTGDTSQRCGGGNVVSVYQATPAVRTQLPRRCSGGYWVVRLNRSDVYQPSLQNITENRMMWRAADMTKGPTEEARVSLKLCMWKCETLPTCWSVIEQAAPGRYVGCVLLDHGATREAVNTRPQRPPRGQKYGLAEWVCGGSDGGVLAGQQPDKGGELRQPPDSDRLQEAGAARGGIGQRGANSGVVDKAAVWTSALTVASVISLTMACQ